MWGFWHRSSVFALQPLCVRRCAHAGSERVAGIERRIQHAAALHSVGGAHGAVGEDGILDIAVVSGIGVDDAADSAVLGSELGLDAAPGVAIAR